MDVTTRVANEADLPFLCEVDRHLSRDDQAHLVSLGRVNLAEVDGAPSGVCDGDCSGTRSRS